MTSSQSPYVFLSYARPDAERVQEIYAKLVHVGLNAWMDTQCIEPGDDWKKTISKALQLASLVIVFLSKNSVTRNGYLQREIKEALDVWADKAPGTIYLIPVRLDDCPIHEDLAKFHWVNLYEQSGWEKLQIQIRKVTMEQSIAIRRGKKLPGRPAKKRPAQLNLGSKVTRVAGAIPVVIFPDPVKRFVIDSASREEWLRLNEATQRFVLTLGCKLEPIVQLVPATPNPPILGFECLGLGALGESFPEICDRCDGLDEGLLRICLAIVAIETATKLREETVRRQTHGGAHHTIFTINLDPFMVESDYFKKFLNWYHGALKQNVIFEVNETTTKQYLPRLKNLQVDFNLRYAADDLNGWHKDVRTALVDRVEMTKIDYSSFQAAMSVRGDDKDETIRLLLAHKLDDKPLIVEGVEDRDYVNFLWRHWDPKKFGALYGQGYILESDLYWAPTVRPLKGIGSLRGGSYLLDAPSHDTPVE